MREAWNGHSSIAEQLRPPANLWQNPLSDGVVPWGRAKISKEEKKGKTTICLSTRMAAMSLRQNMSINRHTELKLIIVIIKPSKNLQKIAVGLKIWSPHTPMTLLSNQATQYLLVLFSINGCIHTSSLWAIKKIIGAKWTQSHSFLSSSGGKLMMPKESDTLLWKKKRERWLQKIQRNPFLNGNAV